jgi:RNA polymerase sigma factor (sigma-70 family)
MNDQQCGYDLDLAKMDDGVLLVMAVECEYDEAANELVVRHLQWISNLVCVIAKRYGLPVHDIDDVRQEASMAVKKAVKRFDTSQMTRLNSRSFRALAGRVIADSIKDFVKHEARVQRHLVHAPHVAPVTHAGVEDCECTPVFDRACLRDESPAVRVEQKEMHERLQKAIGQLSTELRVVAGLMLDGYKLGQIAERLSIGYELAKWRRRQVLQKLKTALLRA